MQRVHEITSAPVLGAKSWDQDCHLHTSGGPGLLQSGRSKLGLQSAAAKPLPRTVSGDQRGLQGCLQPH